jgi:Ribosomal protein L7/L12 C-terminal domain
MICPDLPKVRPVRETISTEKQMNNNAMLLILCLLPIGLLLPISWRLDSTDRRLRVLSRIDAKLDLLLKQAGIEYHPYTNLPPNVVDALRRGKKIEAIKHYRQATGVGLKEAKDVIEDVQRIAGI